MRKINKPTRSFSDKKKPAFRSKPGSYKKDGDSSVRGEKDKDGYKAKRSFTKDTDYKNKDRFSKGTGSSDKSFESRGDKEKRPFSKDRTSKSKDGFEKKPFRSYDKKEGSDKPRHPFGKRKVYGEKKSSGTASTDSEPEKLSYKAKRSFTKNKEFRKDGGYSSPKRSESSFGKDRFDKEKKRFSEKPERFSREKDPEDKTPFKRNDKFKPKQDEDSKSSFTKKPFKKDFDGAEGTKRVKHDDFEEGKTFSGGYKKEYSDEKKSGAKRLDKRAAKSKTESPDGLTRLNKYLANAGIASRREADTLIKSGVVKVNGVPITEMGYKIKPGDTVTYGDSAVKSERKVYLLLNKPKDYITTVDDPQERKTVMELIAGACRERVYPVGRLDRNTTGLLLFTNDGELTKKLTHPKHEIKKVYHVSLNKGLKPEDFKSIIEGVELEDGMVTADDLAFIGEGKKEIGIEIHSGRNRIIRRIFEHLGYEVLKLDRVTFAGLTKKDLPRGKYRFLNPKEVSFLQMIG
jgi:23S rRNA pseudouridine2605 synthase